MLTSFTIQHAELHYLSTRPLFVRLSQMIDRDKQLTDYRNLFYLYELHIKNSDIILIIELVKTIKRIIYISTPLISLYTFDAKYLESFTILNEAERFD